MAAFHPESGCAATKASKGTSAPSRPALACPRSRSSSSVVAFVVTSGSASPGTMRSFEVKAGTLPAVSVRLPTLPPPPLSRPRAPVRRAALASTRETFPRGVREACKTREFSKLAPRTAEGVHRRSPFRPCVVPPLLRGPRAPDPPHLHAGRRLRVSVVAIAFWGRAFDESARGREPRRWFSDKSRWRTRN